MSENPLVSVLMPTYNHEKYVRQAIESVFMQQVDFKYEIVIGEDCSTDSTRSIVIEYQKKYNDRIRLILHEQNMGLNSNAGKMYQEGKGRYFALLEGDDYWTDQNKLQKQVAFLEKNPDFAICFHNMQIIYEDEPYKNCLSNFNQQEITSIEELASYGNYIHSASCIFRKYLSELPYWFYQCPAPDYVLLLLSAQYGKIKFIDEVMGVYRIHKGGTWGPKGYSYQMEKTVELLEKIENKFDKKINQNLNNCLHDSDFQLAEYYLKNRDYEKYKLCLMRIIVRMSNDTDCLVEEIKKMDKEKYDSIRKMKNSYSHKLGNIILKPLRIVRKTFF
jgi:glycosyltransferase involved in cell wall biosynthesis